MSILERFITLKYCKIKNYKSIAFRLTKDLVEILIFIEKPKNPIIALKTLWGIKIDRYFYDFNYNEQRATIWHEKYHQRLTTDLKLFFWLPLRWVFNKENRKYTLFQLEEFDADRFASRKIDKKYILDILQKIKELEEKGIIKSSPRHPPIEERIKRIQSLK
jgi:hypothetical protein